ncbi:MAG: arginine--tRNA ligase [Patescibacteria group bacterium]|nr:arginine--tRNA ligase [Patescibacteria group bacterium]
MKKKVQEQIFEIVKRNWPDVEIKFKDVEVSYPSDEQGEYSSNMVMKLAGRLKIKPAEIAETIRIELFRSVLPLRGVEIVEPGFLNIKMGMAYLQRQVNDVIEAGSNYGNSNFGKNRKIQVEFVSANPTGPIHLGNGRGGPMGDTMVKVFDKAGFDAESEYYVNDFGNQVKILGHSVLKDSEAEYKGDYIDKLHEAIGKDGDDPFIVGRKAAIYITEKIIKQTMEKAGIDFDQYFSEKSLHDSGEVDEMLKYLKEEKFTYEDDDALWFRSKDFGDDKDRVVKKSTGEMTYFGTDIAYHKNKLDRGYEKIINIWGADHHGDVSRVMGAVDALGHKGKLQIILSQFVRVIKDGKEYKMSKRKGTYVSLDDLLEEAGKDAVRFFFLMHSPDTHMDFDLNLAKEKSDKNPVFYVQYAHARICSILSKTDMVTDDANMGLLEHPKELALIRRLSRLPELVEDVARSYEVHRFPYYAMALADSFHSFYHECKVLDEKNEDMTKARLRLVQGTKIVLAETMRLMGVDAPEKM